MAIISKMKASNGVTVYVDDRYAARKGTPEYERARKEVSRVAYNILVNNWMREHPEEARRIREHNAKYVVSYTPAGDQAQ